MRKYVKEINLCLLVVYSTMTKEKKLQLRLSWRQNLGHLFTFGDL